MTSVPYRRVLFITFWRCLTARTNGFLSGYAFDSGIYMRGKSFGRLKIMDVALAYLICNHFYESVMDRYSCVLRFWRLTARELVGSCPFNAFYVWLSGTNHECNPCILICNHLWNPFILFWGCLISRNLMASCLVMLLMGGHVWGESLFNRFLSLLWISTLLYVTPFEGWLDESFYGSCPYAFYVWLSGTNHECNHLWNPFILDSNVFDSKKLMVLVQLCLLLWGVLYIWGESLFNRFHESVMDWYFCV